MFWFYSCLKNDVGFARALRHFRYAEMCPKNEAAIYIFLLEVFMYAWSSFELSP